jgi:protoheme IX farnesyltransferase
MKERLKIYAELGKMRITFFVAISGSVGYILASGDWSINMLITVLAIFLLSSGSAAFNHIQEISTDSLMNRTKNRPLPSDKISREEAVIFASAMSIAGILILLVFTNLPALVFGLLALIWYNIIYTPMKKVTAMAVVPGAVVGALPPAIGWAAAGGSLIHPQLFALGLFFFIWQIPHFWFLFLIYDKDYRRAGFPTLTQKYSKKQLVRISYVWIVALAVTTLMIPYFGLNHNIWTNALLLLAGVILVWRTGKIINLYKENLQLKFAFRDINIYVLTVVLVLSIDSFIN